MNFNLLSMENAATVLKDSLNENIFLFSMDVKALSDKKYTEEELINCTATSYFESSGWTTSTAKNLENFSAIAYSFAYYLQKKLIVPVGVICNAIGGAPIQSWISRASMEQKHVTVDLLNDTHLNPMVGTWVTERIVLNMEDAENEKIKARHPYQPTMLFYAGILPLANYNIKGVICYQGESNADRPEIAVNQDVLGKQGFKIVDFGNF